VIERLTIPNQMTEKLHWFCELALLQISQCMGCSNTVGHAKTFEALT
jgi:hypothetical protein